MKKILALVLSVAMLLSLTAAVAEEAGFEETPIKLAAPNPEPAEEAVLDEKDKVDPTKLNALIFDQFRHGYYVSGEQVGKAWNAGAALMKK